MVIHSPEFPTSTGLNIPLTQTLHTLPRKLAVSTLDKTFVRLRSFFRERLLPWALGP